MPETPRRLRALIREPLVHFLVVGAAIFAAFAAVTETEELATADRIVISGGDIERLSGLWENRWQRPPTPDEMAQLIREHVREEVLYRQALALGLDRDDTAIRRLLRQKFEFVTQDLAVAGEPAEADLIAFYEANLERYTAPPSISFTQVYFDPDRRGAAVEHEARVALAGLRIGGADAAGLGDGQMLDSSYRDVTIREVELLFGGAFVAQIDTLEPAVWSGPVSSGYGLHLVRIDDRRAAEALPLEQVRERVRADWEYEQRQQANEAIYQQLLTRYEVLVETPGGDAARTAATTEETRP